MDTENLRLAMSEPGGLSLRPSASISPTKGFTVCRAVKCRNCGKTTWAGCGAHVDAVRRNVRPDDWCDGHTSPPPSRNRWNPFRRNRA